MQKIAEHSQIYVWKIIPGYQLLRYFFAIQILLHNPATIPIILTAGISKEYKI